MAVNDVASSVPTSIANNAFLTIQPATGAEWAVFNIYAGGACELYWADGTNDLKFDSCLSNNVFHFPSGMHITNTKYLKVKNVSGAVAFFAHDGAVRK